jgi:hypothetical protein
MLKTGTSIKIPALFFLCLFFLGTSMAQTGALTLDQRTEKKADTEDQLDRKAKAITKDQLDRKEKADTTKKERSIASKAALRSAILPGWGQAYNKKYWKIPIVYGVLAIPLSTFRYNSDWYDKTRFAYTTRVTRDTANYRNIAPELVPLSTESLRLYRNSFRKNMDFSILGLLVVWGLNIVDATVDGHLRTFTITDDLGIQLSPTIPPGTKGQFGLTASFHFNKQRTGKTGMY